MNTSFSNEEQMALIEGRPQTVRGLTLHPITVRSYGAWMDAQPVLLLRLSTLPAALAVKPYLDAVFTMEMQSVAAGKPLGMLRRLTEVLCLALRLGTQYAGQAVRFAVDRNDPFQLRSIAIYSVQTKTVTAAAPDALGLRLPDAVSAPWQTPKCFVEGSDHAHSIGRDGLVLGFPAMPGVPYAVQYEALSEKPAAVLRPMEFDAVRKAIAAMNGAELPDETENPELVEAMRQRNAMTGTEMAPSLTDLIDAVALASGVRIGDVLDWTIHSFEVRRRSIDRARRFTINGFGECCGAKWKDGNPVPSWWADRADDLRGGFASENDVIGKLTQVGTIH